MVFLTKILNKFKPKIEPKQSLKEPKLFPIIIERRCISFDGTLIHDKRNTIIKINPKDYCVYMQHDKPYKRYYILSSRLKLLKKLFE